MTDGGEGLRAVLQLTAQVEVAHPVAVAAAGFCHLLFRGQVCRKADQERQQAPVAPGEAVRMPPAARVALTHRANNRNHSDHTHTHTHNKSRPGVSLRGHGITALRGIVGKGQLQPVLFQ